MKKLSPFLIILSACLWGTIGIAVKELNQLGLGAMQVVFLRAAATVILMSPVLLIYNKTLFKIRLKDVWCFIGTGIVSIVLFTFFNFYTIKLTTLSFASIMMYTAPFIMVFLAAIFFKEKITVKKIMACILAFLGCCLVAGIFGNQNTITWISISTGLASGFFYALYTVFSRYSLSKGYLALTITFYTFVFSLFGSLPFINIKETMQTICISPNSLIYIGVIAVFNTIAPYILYTSGLKGVESGVALILATAEPVVATIIGIIIYNEGLTLLSFIGIILVILSVIILNVKFRGEKQYE